MTFSFFMHVLKQSYYLVLLFMIPFILHGCNHADPVYTSGYNSFRDYSYPCISIEFKEPFKLEKTTKIHRDLTSVTTYLFSKGSMQDTVTVIKFTKKGLEPRRAVWEGYSKTSIIDFSGDALTDDTSYVIAFVEDDGIKIRGIIREIVSDTSSYDIIFDKLIVKAKDVLYFNSEQWKNSRQAEIFISNMKENINWYLEHTNSVSCSLQY